MKKSKYLIIGLFVATITIVGATFAFFTATISNNGISSNTANFNVIYTGGDEISGSIKILSDKTNADNTTVHISMGSDSPLTSANLYININSITENIATSRFKWEVVGVKNSTTVYTNSGTFEDATANDKIKIVDNYALDYEDTAFTVYFWLESSSSTDDSSLLGSSFSAYISAETANFTGTIPE